MRLRTLGLAAAITVGWAAGTASAQDDSRVGITMGYPASIGILWQATERVALRPEITLSRTSAESTATSSLTVFTPDGRLITSTTTSRLTNDLWQVSAGLSALFYLTKHDALRTYLSPRWAYTRSSNSSTSDRTAIVTSGDSTGQFVGGSVGAQYALGRRFSVFGEIGLGFSRTRIAPTVITTVVPVDGPINVGGSVTRTLATRSGAGVVLYF
jgi:hypothetical protein